MTATLPSYRSHGARPSDPSKLAGLLDAALHPMIGAKLGAGALPSESNILGPWGIRFNQLNTESCSAHAGSAALSIALSFAGCALPFVPSPHVLYSASGRIEMPRGPLLDNGRQLADVVTAMHTFGVAPTGDMPDGPTDITPINVCQDVTPDEIALARQHLLSYGNHLIDPAGAGCEDQVIATLTSQHPAPVYLGANVGDAFQALEAGDVAEPDTSHGPTDGGHALCIVGHRTRADGSREYLVLNSWGDDWCEGGLCWASAAWLRACWELRPFTAASPTLLQRIAASLGLP